MGYVSFREGNTQKTFVFFTHVSNGSRPETLGSPNLKPPPVVNVDERTFATWANESPLYDVYYIHVHNRCVYINNYKYTDSAYIFGQIFNWWFRWLPWKENGKVEDSNWILLIWWFVVGHELVYCTLCHNFSTHTRHIWLKSSKFEASNITH